MNTTLLCFCLAQGVSFIGVLLFFAFRAGRLLERVAGNDDRITALEQWRDRACNVPHIQEVPHA